MHLDRDRTSSSVRSPPLRVSTYVSRSLVDEYGRDTGRERVNEPHDPTCLFHGREYLERNFVPLSTIRLRNLSFTVLLLSRDAALLPTGPKRTQTRRDSTLDSSFFPKTRLRTGSLIYPRSVVFHLSFLRAVSPGPIRPGDVRPLSLLPSGTVLLSNLGETTRTSTRPRTRVSGTRHDRRGSGQVCNSY